MESFSAYVHIPYCTRKCPYCDFNVHVARRIPEDRYVDALIREIAVAARDEDWCGRAVSTVFFGGGTPSLFSAASIGHVLSALEAKFGLQQDAEISLEANPEDLTACGHDGLGDLRACGVTRVSIGAQSFVDRHLATLGRLHRRDDIVAMVEAARRAGFESVSCDLIFAVPGQTFEEWSADLDAAVALGLDHVSAYGLTYEEGTAMTRMRRRGQLQAVEEDTELEMFRAANERLGAAGYEHYEISNYARPGHRSRHNVAYWSWRDYLGLGAGAHGFVRQARDRAPVGAGSGTLGAGAAVASGAHAAYAREEERVAAYARRYSNFRQPQRYMDADGTWTECRENIGRRQAVAEFLLTRLRMTEGFAEMDFERAFGSSLEVCVPAYSMMAAGGFIERALEGEQARIRLTRAGIELADSVITRLAAL